jgi:hypothetical protein
VDVLRRRLRAGDRVNVLVWTVAKVASFIVKKNLEHVRAANTTL